VKLRTGGPHTRDYFAEMYVAGIMADNGWNVYFPRRDKGFDFIVTRPTLDGIIVRPVQVKGKYPMQQKGEAKYYGYSGRVTEFHDDMVLAIAFFTVDVAGAAPIHIAYMPKSQIRRKTRGYACHPARFHAGEPEPRRDFKKYFDADGLEALASPSWK
jgi:hypothetical protein